MNKFQYDNSSTEGSSISFLFFLLYCCTNTVNFSFSYSSCGTNATLFITLCDQSIYCFSTTPSLSLSHTFCNRSINLPLLSFSLNLFVKSNNIPLLSLSLSLSFIKFSKDLRTGLVSNKFDIGISL